MNFFKKNAFALLQGIPSFLKRYLVFLFSFDYKFQEFMALSFLFIPFTWLVDQIIGMFFENYTFSICVAYCTFLASTVAFFWSSIIEYFNENQWWAIFWIGVLNGVATYWLYVTYLFIMKELEALSTNLTIDFMYWIAGWVTPKGIKLRKLRKEADKFQAEYLKHSKLGNREEATKYLNLYSEKLLEWVRLGKE